jgi:hypothetical protein
MGRKPKTDKSLAKALIRWGDSSITWARGSAAKACKALVRSAPFAGKNPQKTKPASCALVLPQALSKAVTLLAPGMGITRRPWAATAWAKRAPGSLMPWVPASLT